MKSNRFLIIRLSSIGDIILTTPLIRALRNTYPNSVIDFIVNEEYEELLLNNPYIDNLYLFESKKGFREIFKWRKRIRNNRYSFIFDLHRNNRTILMTRWLRNVDIGKVNKRIIKRFVLVKFGLNLYKKIVPMTNRYFEAASKHKLIDDCMGTDLFSHGNMPLEIDSSMERKYLIVMVPGAGFFTKRWLPDYFAELADNLIEKNKAEIYLIGSGDDRNICSEIKNKMNNYVHDLSGNYNLLETASIIAASDAVITNDTGMMHVAVSQKKPVLSFFGSTTEELGFFPYGNSYEVLENKELNCRPCSHIGRHRCPKGHFKCMKDLSPEMAYRSLLNLLGINS